MKYHLLLATALISGSTAHAASGRGLVNGLVPAAMGDVDPYIGVDWEGEVFPGALVPFGMVKIGPDMEGFDGKPGKSGYLSSGRILGFSHLHLSGCAGKYGNVLVTPVSGALDLSDLSSARDEERARPGLFRTHLTRYDIEVELTATRRVGVHRYTFVRGGASHIVFSLDHILTKGNGPEGQRFLGGALDVLSDHELSGVGHYAGGWNEGGPYDVYFYATVDHTAATSLWADEVPKAVRHVSLDHDAKLGGSFDLTLAAGTVVTMKVGISFVSVEQARRNVDEEVPSGDFSVVAEQGEKAWMEALSAIDIPLTPASRRRQFYTALYHTMIMPSDYTGENAKWQTTGLYFDDFYTIWGDYPEFCAVW